MKQGETAPIPVRLHVQRELGVDFPPSAEALFHWLASLPRKPPLLSFSVHGMPPTLNHMYTQVGHRRILSAEAQDFRRMVQFAIGTQRHSWAPKGTVIAMVMFQSPFWVTKKNHIKDMDGDNRFKALFDAVQATTGVPDCTNWEFHGWKVPSRQSRTLVYLYDMGDIVHYFP